MAEEATLKWSELKKTFQETDKKELIDLIRELYKYSVDNRRFISARYAKAEDGNAILEAYRKKVVNVYFSPRGVGVIHYPVAKKSINDYYKASGDVKGTMDLALTLVETVLKFMKGNSGIDRASYDGTIIMLDKFCDLARTQEGRKVYPQFKERVQKLSNDSSKGPYGFGDSIEYHISDLEDEIFE